MYLIHIIISQRKGFEPTIWMNWIKPWRGMNSLIEKQSHKKKLLRTRPTWWHRSYRKYILQTTQPSQYRNAKLQYRFVVTSGSPSIYWATLVSTHPDGNVLASLDTAALMYYIVFNIISLHESPLFGARRGVDSCTLYCQSNVIQDVRLLLLRGGTGWPRSYRKHNLQITQPSPIQTRKITELQSCGNFWVTQ